MWARLDELYVFLVTCHLYLYHVFCYYVFSFGMMIMTSVCLLCQICLLNCALYCAAAVITRKPLLSFKPSWTSVFSDRPFSDPTLPTKMPSTSCLFTGTAVRRNSAKMPARAGRCGLKMVVNRQLASSGTAKVHISGA